MFKREQPLPPLNFIQPTEEENEVLKKGLGSAIRENRKYLFLILLLSALILIGLPITTVNNIINGHATPSMIMSAIAMFAVCAFAIWFVIAKKLPKANEVIKNFENAKYMVYHAEAIQIAVKDYHEKTVVQEGKVVFSSESNPMTSLPVKYLSKQIKEKAKKDISGALIVKIDGAKYLYGFLLFNKKSFFY